MPSDDGNSVGSVIATLQAINHPGAPPVSDGGHPAPTAAMAALPAMTTQPQVPTFTLDDYGNAGRFCFYFGDEAVYCAPLDSWFVWDGRCWIPDAFPYLQVRKMAMVIADMIPKEILPGADKDTIKAFMGWRGATRSLRKTLDMLELAKSKALFDIARFDANPMLFNVQNGTVDLETGVLLPHDPGHFITKMSPIEFDPDVTCPIWEAFLYRVMDGDKEMIEWLQRAVGYSVTGLSREQVFFLLHGSGRNGKSTFVSTVNHILGDYYVHAEETAFIQTRFEQRGHREDITRLAGSRFVGYNEIPINARLHESLIKSLVGGDPVTARGAYEKHSLQFVPGFKIWMYVNHQPYVTGQDEGIWRRFIKVPFDIIIPEAEKDDNLGEKLKAEATGILAWCIRGCQAWQQRKLRPLPSRIAEATEIARTDSDVLNDFLEDWCERGADHKIVSQTLFKAYETWCWENSGKPYDKLLFYRMMDDRGFKKRRAAGNQHHFFGIRLHPDILRQLEGYWKANDRVPIISVARKTPPAAADSAPTGVQDDSFSMIHTTEMFSPPGPPPLPPVRVANSTDQPEDGQPNGAADDGDDVDEAAFEILKAKAMAIAEAHKAAKGAAA